MCRPTLSRVLSATFLLPLAASNSPAATPQAKAEAASAHAGHGKHGAAASAATKPSSGDDDAEKPADKKPDSVYDFGLPTEDGKNLALSDYKGKVLLIVNLARQSSYNDQLAGLEMLSSTFADKGLVVVGVPSNDFGSAEPGTPSEVASFYTAQKVPFPVMQVSTLTGVHELPLFSYLAASKSVPNSGLHWNYTKFLIDRKGKLIACFPPEVSPGSLELTATVQEAVDGTWKPKKAAGPKGEESSDDDDDF